MADAPRRGRGLDTIVNLRMSNEELAELESLRERLQQDAPAGHLTTRREVMLAALQLLRAKYTKLDADRERRR